MDIRRVLDSAIKSKMYKGKVIILIGARQVGKSTLFRTIAAQEKDNPLILNCDDPETRRVLSDISEPQMRLLVGDSPLIIIDEVQRVDNIGITLKRMVEKFPDRQFMVTGSSSLHIRSNINEPLTGRKYEYELYPISTGELLSTGGLLMANNMFEQRLIYGSYPEIITHPEEARELLVNLAGSYLYKDILEVEGIRKPVILEKLLMALALQIGSEVSYNELAQTVGSDSKTIEKYIDLLEKCYVIKRINGLSRHLRNELKKSKKIYFYDTGIRNAILQNFAPCASRTDMGAIWENFFIMERIKYNAYRGANQNYYFWRTKSQQEIDFVEERDGKMTIFEMKWSPRNSNAKFPQSFLNAYPVDTASVVTPENYLDFLI